MTTPYSEFALEVAKWLHKADCKGQPPDAAALTQKSFTAQMVGGEITEMTASARLDADLGNFRDLVGVDFEVAKTCKLKQLPVGGLALAPAILALGTAPRACEQIEGCHLRAR